MSLEVGVVLRSKGDTAAEARAIESLGYDYVCAGEHISFNVPVGNSFVSLSVAAAVTTSIKLMSTITLAPLYPPALLAKLSAALGVASRGRFNLGVGVGGENPVEFDACDVPLTERGARTDEALEVLRLLWSTDDASFEGRFNSFSGLTIAPRWHEAPPVWVSGRSDAAMRRAARYGDGWLPYMYSPEMVADSLTKIDAMRERDGAVWGGLFVWCYVHEHRATAEACANETLSATYAQDFSTLVDKYALAGTPDSVVRRLCEFRDAGVRTCAIQFACPDDRVAEARRVFSREVLPAFQS